MVQYTNNTKKLLQTAEPGQGAVYREEGSKPRPREIESANWLVNYLGGDVRFLAESREQGIETADITWRGGLLEMKHLGGNLNTLRRKIGRGLQQSQGNGLLIDTTNMRFAVDDILSTAIDAMSTYKGRYLILIKDDELIGYIHRK